MSGWRQALTRLQPGPRRAVVAGYYVSLRLDALLGVGHAHEGVTLPVILSCPLVLSDSL